MRTYYVGAAARLNAADWRTLGGSYFLRDCGM